MKKIKKMLAVLSSITVLTGMVGMTAFADDETKEIIEAVKQFDKSFAEVLESTSTEADIESIAKENIYRSYSLDGIYEKNYYDAESFESLISDKARIYVEAGNRLITVFEEDGKYRAVGETLQSSGKSVVELKQESERIKEEINEEIADMKFCQFDLYHISVIYYKTAGGNEFAVPYADSNYFGEFLENGKLYTAKEFLNQMKNVYDPDSDSDTDIGYLGTSDTYIIGDANSDYCVDVRDCSYIVRMLASNRKGMLKDVCDYNKDGVINVRDASAIAAFLKNR